MLIGSTENLQAVAYMSGLADSAVTSGVYTIHPLPPQTGLVAWYSGLNVLPGTSTMTAWDDGTSNQFTATGNASYASSVSALNNQPAVYFNGSQTMLTASMSSVFTNSTGGMFFVLYAPNTSSTGWAYLTQNNAGYLGTWDDYGGGAYIDVFMNATGLCTNNYPASITTNPALMEVESSPSGYLAWLSDAAGVGTPPSAQYWQAPTTFTLGGGSSAAPDFTGWLAEVLIYNSASDTVRKGVETYIKTVYGVGSVTPCAMPTFSPAMGIYGSAQNVSISTATNGATIRYTTDGSTPSETNGTIYSTPVNISVNTTLQAIAYLSGMPDSLIACGNYAIQCAAPTFSPTAGTFTNSATVTISTSTGGATICYTTDGSTPSTTNGTVYSGPVTITATATLQAIAYENGLTNSIVASGIYSIIPLPADGMLLWLHADAITGLQQWTIRDHLVRCQRQRLQCRV